MPLEAIAGAELTAADVEHRTVPASQLWADAPCVVLVFRRPGCGAFTCASYRYPERSFLRSQCHVMSKLCIFSMVGMQ